MYISHYYNSQYGPRKVPIKVHMYVIKFLAYNITQN